LPYALNKEQLEMRKQQWRSIDNNGNGYVSLAEVDAGMSIFDLPNLFDIKPVLIRAFTAAKTKGKAKNKYSDDYVTKGEYRWLLKYLRMYFELWIAFDEIDTGNDGRISFKEFEAAKSTLEEWGVDMKDPKKQWKLCDKNNGGKILFDEFSEWAIKNNLDLDDAGEDSD